jgi:hypothetical protein
MIYRKLTEILLQFWINGYKLVELLAENRDYLMENHARKSVHALVGNRKKYTPSKTRKIKHHGVKEGKMLSRHSLKDITFDIDLQSE